MLDDLYKHTAQRADKKGDITIVKKALPVPFYCPSLPMPVLSSAPELPSFAIEIKDHNKHHATEKGNSETGKVQFNYAPSAAIPMLNLIRVPKSLNIAKDTEDNMKLHATKKGNTGTLEELSSTTKDTRKKETINKERTDATKDYDNIDNNTRSKRNIHKELENVIGEGSKDNAENTTNENVEIKIGGVFQWLKGSLQMPTLLKRSESTMIANTIVSSEAKQKSFNKSNDIPSSYADRALEIVGYNTDYTAANSSSISPIGNGTNNSVQAMISSTIGNGILLWIILKKPYSSSSNNYVSPQKEKKIKLDKLASDILPSLHSIDNILKDISLNEGLLEDGLLENELHDSPFSNNSSHQLQGDIQENGAE